MKFKLLSLVLLLACFLFLGVLSGVIPVSGGDAAAVMRLFPSSPPDDGASDPTQTPAPTRLPTAPPAERQSVSLPTPRLAGTAAPEPTGILTGATAVPARTPSPSPAVSSPEPTEAAGGAPTRRTVSVQGASPAPAESPAPTATSTPAPTAALSPTPAAQAAGQADDTRFWEPDTAVVSTTITWSDPLQNDTDIPLDGAALLDEPPQIVLPARGTQILIIHTHGTEAYTPAGDDRYEATSEYRTIDTDHTVIQVGLALGRALEEQGFRVKVDTELYDWPSYSGSYGRAEAAIERYLAEEPDIAMIIDLHRDAFGDEEKIYKPVSDELDTAAAQLMFVVGTDENLTHPRWRDNLALAVSLQALVEEKYPHLMRPTLVCPYRYNQQFTTGSLLLEVGAAGNTMQEAIEAAELFADAVGPALAERVAA